MSAFSPQTFDEAKLAFKPLKRSGALHSATGHGKPRLKDNKARKAARKKKAKRVKVPGTKKVQSIFNKMVRERANWTCIRCGRDCAERKGLLHASHFWGVGFTATRFDFDNVDALCYPCHYGQLGTGWEYCKQGDYRTYMIKKLGQDRYDALEQKARSQKKLLEAKLEFLASLQPEQKHGD